MNWTKLLMWILMGKRLPITSGTLCLPGISKPVRVVRDKYGIPVIKAENKADAYYGLGFCQGQDRAFQLEMLLRVNHGTLAEIIGEGGLTIDRLSRRLGFSRYAKLHYNLLEEESKHMIDAFAKGVNEGMVLGCKKLPHGFAILRSKPTPWTGVDVIAGGNYIAFGLSPWSGKLTRLLLLTRDGPEAVKSIDPDYGEWLPVTKPVKGLSGEGVNRLIEDLEKLTSILGISGNSNNWTLNASLTSTGRPLLANDPHLWPAIPTQWYLAHLEAPDIKVAGAAFVGAPNIPSGHNDYAAWGVTASIADNIDLYLEKIGDDGKSIKNGEPFIPCERISEEYLIKGRKAFKEDILITPRGPIISDVLDVESGLIDGYALSLQATWMSPQQVDGLISLHHVKDFESFRHALSKARLISQNVVYADVNDNVGWQYTSDVPQRGDGFGVFPFPGWDKRFHWKFSSTPWDEMPHLHNPEPNFVATANNKPFVGDKGVYLGRDWLEYRFARIVDMLSNKRDWDLVSTQQMQLDRLSIPWQEMKTIVLNTPCQDIDAQFAISVLDGWDGVVSSTSPGAAVYEFFVISMVQRMARSKAPNSVKYALAEGFHPLVERSFFGIRSTSNLVRNLKTKPEGWFENGWIEEVEKALAEAVHMLKEKCGEKLEDWSWGSVHRLVLRHPLGVRPPLDKVYNRGPFPTGGDYDTVSPAGRQSDMFGSNVTGLANLRAIHDVGNWDQSRYVIAGGQSGNPFSPHYDDLLNLWLRGEMVNMAWSEEAVKRSTKQILNLLPRDK